MRERDHGGEPADVEFLGAGDGVDDGADDGWSDGPPDARSRRRRRAALAVVAGLVFAGTVSLLVRGGDPEAEPRTSPVIPTFTGATGHYHPRAVPRDAGACPQPSQCPERLTSAAAVASIRTSLTSAFGALRSLRVTTRVGADGELYSRAIRAIVPSGRLLVVLARTSDAGTGTGASAGHVTYSDAFVDGFLVQGFLAGNAHKNTRRDAAEAALADVVSDPLVVAASD